MSIYEILGTVLGIIGVWLMIRQNVWGWPVGIVQVAIYAWVFYDARLYSDALLQLFFLTIQAYGWWHWLRGEKGAGGAKDANRAANADPGVASDAPTNAAAKQAACAPEAGTSPAAPGSAGRLALPVTRLRWQGVLGWMGAGAIATAAWGELMRRTTDAALPHWDSFVLVFSLIAQWLQARKRLECWAGWMIVNVVAIGVYWAKDLRLTAGLYLVFFGMAVAGHVAWRRSLATSVAH